MPSAPHNSSAGGRSRVVVAIAAIAVVAIAAPGASADPGFPGFSGVPGVAVAPSPVGNVAGLIGPCGRSTPQGQGGTGSANQNQICQGAGLVFVGPAVGQVVSIVGPTIIGPAAVGNIALGAGDVAVTR